MINHWPPKTDHYYLCIFLEIWNTIWMLAINIKVIMFTLPAVADIVFPVLQPIFQPGIHHLVQTKQVYTNVHQQLDLTHGGWSCCRGLAAALQGCRFIPQTALQQDLGCLGQHGQVRLAILIYSTNVQLSCIYCLMIQRYSVFFSFSSKDIHVTTCCHILCVMGDIATHLNEDTKYRIVGE